jgi:prolyl-tRNA synthetase
MRLSQLFGQTLREIPADADIASHQLLLRAGLIRPVAAGIYAYLPLARRALNRIEAIVRAEMDAIGGQEVTMPVVQPAELWQETGRWYEIGPEMARLKDRGGRDLVLAMTHEEVVGDLVRREIHSYRQLPRLIYHLQTKFRDEPRARGGLIRVREFTMKDSYSLDADWAGLDRQYRAHYQAYFRIFRRCGLADVIAVQSDVGMMGGQLAHEFMYLSPIGEDTLIVCPQCGYAANRQIATFHKPAPAAESPLALEEVATPDTTTIAALARLLDIPASRTAKAYFAVATLVEGTETREQFVFAVVRGDMEVNEAKLANVVKAQALRPATEAEIHAIGAEPGYGSPIGTRRDAYLLVVDDLMAASPNLVAGANRVGYHLRHTNCGRDFQADLVADIVTAEAGYACGQCGAPLDSVRGVEVGNIFKLGTRYSTALHATFLDVDGREQAVIMGSYGIGIGRLLACVVEAHHDAAGIVWPVTVAPYQVHLVVLGRKAPEATAAAEALYQQLWDAGIETLFDDREESPGVKFNDADLLGLPVRLTVSARTLQVGGVELKPRARGDAMLVPHADVVTGVQQTLEALAASLRRSSARVEVLP